MPRSENTICAIVSPRKDLVRGTNPPTEQSTHTATDIMRVVYMARNVLPRTDHYAPSAEDASRLGNVGSVSQVQDAPISHVYIELTRRFGNSVLAGSLEPERTNIKPPNRNTIPNKLTCHTLFTRHGICESTLEHRNTQKVQTTSIQGITHIGESRTRRSRTESHPETPDNPLDTCMDHTKHSLDT